MKRDRNKIEQRMDFIIEAINDKKKAASQLREAADKLENCKNTTEIIENLSEVLFCSVSTVERNIYSIN